MLGAAFSPPGGVPPRSCDLCNPPLATLLLTDRDEVLHMSQSMSGNNIFTVRMHKHRPSPTHSVGEDTV